jgi:hypothetical protein
MRTVLPEPPKKLSWSIMNTWDRGDREGALDMMAGKSLPLTPAMIEGSRLHGIIAQERPRLLPIIDETFVFEGVHQRRWESPNYYRTLIAPGLIISGMMDVISAKHGVIIDWKSGNTPITAQNPMQLYLYGAMLDREGIKTQAGIFAKVKADPGATPPVAVDGHIRVKLTDERKQEAVDWAVRIHQEIVQYLGGKSPVLLEGIG